MLTRDNFHQAWRSWTASLKTGGSTVPVILTLALAIGSTTAIFVLVKGLLNVVPYQHPEELTMVWEADSSGGPKELRFSIPDYQDFEAQARSFTHLGVFAPGTQDILVGHNTERVSSAQVSTGFFNVLRVRMAAGRDATKDDTSAVLISEYLWHSRFPGWTDPIGQIIKVDGVDRQVVGIVPSGQEFPSTADLWLPFVPTAESCSCKRNGHSYEVIGRLKLGVSPVQADAEVRTIAARLATQYADTNANVSAWVRPLREELIGETRPAMWMLSWATACLLLMACVSVAVILFARGTARGTEISMRQVLGATRGRILAQLLMESTLSALSASVLGLFIGWWLLHLFLLIVPASLPQIQSLSISPRAMVFATLIALLTVVFFSLLPALSATRNSLLSGIRSGSLPGAPGSSRKIRNGLIIIENTVAFVLLVTASLLLNSLLKLTSVNPGFDQHGRISADLNLSSARYPSPAQRILFFRTLMERMHNVPGVESAAAVDSLPMTGSTEGVAYYPVGTFNKKPGEEPIARASTVTPDYFKTMDIPLRGRDFGSADGEQSHLVIVSEAVARMNWPNENPIGKRIGIRGAGTRNWEVIGVVPDIKDDGLSAAAPPRLYFNQQEFGENAMTVVVRASGDLKGMIPSLRHEVGSLDPTLPIYNFQTIEDLVNNSLARNRVVTRIISAFSVMALILAAVGVYGVILSSLVRRTWEFGVRIALGSTLGRIAWLVWREGLLLVGIGIAAGLVVAFASSRLVSSLLFGVTAVDFPSYLIAGAAQLLVVAGGSLVLLRRIARLDPAAALKNR